jgi:predicted MPP superfamily phosphohydrolase
MLVERNAFTLRNVEVNVLEPGAQPLRILHISDLHLAPWQKSKIEWVTSLAKLSPDLIVNTGDNLGHERALPELKKMLSAFQGVPGVFVNGSNDYFAPEFKNPFTYFSGPSKAKKVATRLDTAALMDFFTEDLGWANLNNSAASLTLGNRRIDFMGVDDPHRSFDSLSRMERSLEALQAEDILDENTPELTIGVAHAPYQRILNEFVALGAEMIFAGHTHGGQVCVPGYGALVTNCDIPREQVKGVSTWQHGGHSAALNVSAGVGTSIYAPVRFACPPEATLITLTPRDS